MGLQFFNTLIRKTEEFVPLEEKKVKMYTCGPTVYDYAHIGNFRTYVFEDILRRYLKYKGYEVVQVMNITDIDDKTIRGSQREGISLSDYTKRFIQAFFEDIDCLNIQRAEFYPHATEHIPEMVNLIERLQKKGYAYKSDDGSIYYDISRFSQYGELAGINPAELKVGARVRQDEYKKEEASDFVLWKAWDEEDGDVFWDTPLGRGRPGWHIECSAMSMKYLGEHFDIHTGGVDNIFPHHQNEIAQSEGATGKKFVNYWLHSEYLIVDGKKMSKSLGNYYTLRDLINKGISPQSLRYLFVSSHYRSKLNFTMEAVSAATKAVEGIKEFMLRLKEVENVNLESANWKGLIDECKANFVQEMDKDLNTPRALASIFAFIREINRQIDQGKVSSYGAKDAIKMLLELDSILGLQLEKIFKTEELPAHIQELIAQREKARAEKEFQKADHIRDTLRDMGIILEDTLQGTRWKRIR